MQCVRNITDDLFYIGGDDRRLNLFENIHPIPNGVSYNSYLLLDEQTVLFDTVDWAICREFLENIEYLLKGRSLDYLIINHAEPDHAASLEEVLLRYPDVKIISTKKAFAFMTQFGFNISSDQSIEVKEGDTQCFGKHTVKFIMAPMVHWPEAMVTFDTTNGVFFTADAFGTFGALNGRLFNDEMDFEKDFLDDARRYYTNIVGKFGMQVQSLLKKASGLDIKMICPLHGPIWRSDIAYFLDKYNIWSSYKPENKGVLIVYASMYGNTEQVAISLASKIIQKGFIDVKVCDVSTTHISDLIALSFKYSHIVIASVTYNLEMYPLMHSYLHDMKALNLQNRTFAIIENGTWACTAGKQITQMVSELKNCEIIDQKVTLLSAINEQTVVILDKLADVLVEAVK